MCINRGVRVVRRLAPLTANFDLSETAAGLAFAATPAYGTRCFIHEYIEPAGDRVSWDLPFTVAGWTIAVAGRVAIGAGQGGHTAPPNSCRNSDLL